VSRDVSAGIRGRMGTWADVRAESPCGHILWSSWGGSGKGAGRENSLASLSASPTSSLCPVSEVSPGRSFRSL
jgi:hypothetical protein